jgi:hypothetical protein
MLSEDAPRVGMRWRERPGGLVRFDMKIIELEPNQVWVEQLEGAGIEGQIALRFAAEGGATRIGVTITLELPRPLELAAPVIRLPLLRCLRTQPLITRRVQALMNQHLTTIRVASRPSHAARSSNLIANATNRQRQRRRVAATFDVRDLPYAKGLELDSRPELAASHCYTINRTPPRSGRL